jgi:hypothetical protein
MTQTLTAQQTQQEKVQGLIKEFSVDKDIIQAVTDIESRYATTQNHYGDYMSFLAPYQAKPTALYIISEALVLAGASRAGVAWAIKILKG